MKKILITLLVLLAPNLAFATTTVPWLTPTSSSTFMYPAPVNGVYQDVGIGTTTPAGRLSVRGISGSSTDLFVVASSSNDQYITVKSGGNIGIGTTTPNARLDIYALPGVTMPLRVSSSSNVSVFEIESSGNVGIGTTTAPQQLTVQNYSQAAAFIAASSTATSTYAGPIQIENSAKVTGLEVYNTADKTTNYERGGCRWTSNVFTCFTEFAGAGTQARIFRFGVGATAANPPSRFVDVQNQPPFYQFSTDTTLVGSYMNITGTRTNTNSLAGALSLNMIYNQTGTASTSDLIINRTETALGSGTHNFLEFTNLTGTNAGRKLTFTNTGNLSLGASTTPSATLTIVGTTTSPSQNLIHVASSTSGIDYLVMNGNGKIGIGTSTAASKLTISGPTDDPTSGIEIQSTTGTSIGTRGRLYPAGNFSLILQSASTGNLNLFNSSGLGISVQSGVSQNVGIGSTTPGALLTVGTSTNGTATTTVFLDSNASKGACLVMKDADGSGYTYIVANNGVLTASTGSCQ